ncbi:hypothetical protein OYT1_ch0133 [Ferriphaselus amnicola]|uniref:Uncharacterized protein n=2 Tax=Ferriphaselus amnicola TaxID=1188319 RepID=A0A2Z6G8G9_9PROT|nr:hypothetical protein OYT1_ch0133 [Ferriphaselus amnicola]
MMRFALSLCTSMLLSAASARAGELPESLQIHGFVSQSAVWTSDNRVGGSQPGKAGFDMYELGGNLSWRPNGNWLLSGQLLSRRAGGIDSSTTRVDYAFIDSNLLDMSEQRVGIRLGKIKNSFGLYNTTRDVAHTRPGVLLPQSIYHDQVRSFFLSAPGVALYGDREIAGGSLYWQISAIRPEVNDRNLTAFMVDQQPGSFDGRTSILGQVLYDFDGGRWRSGLSLGSLKMRYQPAPIDFLHAGTITLNTGVLSLEHNTEAWTHTVEYALTHQIRNGFNVPVAPILDMGSTIEAVYLQTQWRFIPRWQALARFDAVYLDANDRNGQRFSTMTGLPSAQRYARDWTLGLRFDPSKDWSLFLEGHHVNGAAWLSKLDNPPMVLTSPWNLLLMQAAWRF